MGAHANIFGWAKSVAHSPRATNDDLYATPLVLGTNRNHCVMCVKFNKECKMICLSIYRKLFYNQFYL